MSIIKGKAGITAEILADSISESGVRLTTFVIEYPRIILAELNTHRMLSKNSASSRAIPFKRMLEQLNGRPVRFGANQSGMQDKGEDYDVQIRLEDENGSYFYTQLEVWEEAKDTATNFAKAFHEAGYHKQVYNRFLEPFQMMKTVISGTEWDNFFWLRDHDAADPSIAELARVMRIAREESVPKLLMPSEWHLPYLRTMQLEDGAIYGDWVDDLTFIEYSLQDAIKVSCARCCAVSYRNKDYNLEKCLEVYERLVGDDRKHASALEHCATPMKELFGGSGTSWNVNDHSNTNSWEEGISHATRDGELWSGNFRGWIQHRKTIDGENRTL